MKSRIELGLLDRCLQVEQYDEVSSRPLDKTIESAISRSKTLSKGPDVKGIPVLFKTKGDLKEAGDDATISVQLKMSDQYSFKKNGALHAETCSLYQKVLKQDSRAQYGTMGLRAVAFSLIYATAVVLQRNGSSGQSSYFLFLKAWHAI